jgi:hypothetical protein
MKVVFGRKRMDFAALEAEADFTRMREPVVALGTGLPETSVAFAFRDWKELLKFTARTKVGEMAATLDERRRKLSRRRGEDTTVIAERQRVKAQRIEDDLRELSNRTGLPWGSKELFLRATFKADPLEGPIFDPSLLFANPGFGGSVLGVIYPGMPNLGLFPPMNNNVSSVMVVGGLGLFAGTFFTGPSRVLFGVPFFGLAALAAIGFDNVTSSVLVV